MFVRLAKLLELHGSCIPQTSVYAVFGSETHRTVTEQHGILEQRGVFNIFPYWGGVETSAE